MLWLAWLVSAVDATCNPEGFDAKNTMAGRVARDTNVGDIAMRDIDKIADKITNSYRKVAVNKIPFQEAKKGIVKQKQYLFYIFF